MKLIFVQVIFMIVSVAMMAIHPTQALARVPLVKGKTPRKKLQRKDSEQLLKRKKKLFAYQFSRIKKV